MMNYENYIELYEAIYLFSRINSCVNKQVPKLLNTEEIKKIGMDESVYKAMLRILVVNDLLDYDGSCLTITRENMKKQQHILDNIINKDPYKQYSEIYDKATNGTQFFFDSISESEYEIYSRCNFQMTYETGKEVSKHINLRNRTVLELGGNSGGLATALIANNADCLYTIVDTKIPCLVGNEYNKINETYINFIEGDVFELMLAEGIYDSIIIMNFLHDFNDVQCLNILENCIKYTGSHTKFIIIEDVLTDDFEPKAVVMHGLRLSVECRGGKQRTTKELVSLFLKTNYKLEETIRLDSIHTMLILGQDKE